MTDSKNARNSARRQLLKSVVAGGGVLATGKLLPENWARPVVQSVVLPAHAQTSPGPFDGLYVFETNLANVGDLQQGGGILDMFISPAHALVQPLDCKAISQIQIDVTRGNAKICVTYGDNNYPGSTSVNQSTGALAPAAISTVFGVTVDLIDMQVAPDGEAVNGVVDECGPFVATKSSGSFSCPNPNLMSSIYLSSPFADKA